MARTKVTLRQTHDPRQIKNKLASIDNTFDAMDAGTSLRSVVFTGNNGAGPCTVAGTLVGDTVCGVTNLTDATDGRSSFEAAVTVAGQIQQSAVGDLSAKKLVALLLTKSV